MNKRRHRSEELPEEQQKTTSGNRLQHEKSPYLLQHAANPVDWYAWGEEAFDKARSEDKPIFLSIGYSTCHWCHVMERESFEDPEVARLLNEVFVSIKVDREERPDIDAVYMAVCQLMSPSCGWPLTILMTPDKKPFFSATYVPKENRYGRTGMLEMIPRVGELWQNNKQHVLDAAERITGTLAHFDESETGDEPGESLLHSAYEQLVQLFDKKRGGFGSAPKFPSPHSLFFLLRWWKRTGETHALEMVEKTLQEMRKGGIFDQVGYGFHRYAVDAKWVVPHFEKMLYDQAILAIAYIEAFQATGKIVYEQSAREIFDYVLRDLRSGEGGFFSAEDADSEGTEGKFYVWTEDEIRDVLTPAEADLYIAVYHIEKDGNFFEESTKEKTGANIPHLRHSLADLAAKLKIDEDKLAVKLEAAREKLFAARELRVRPGLDDKVLTDWNGLMIAALAKGARVFDDKKFAVAAGNAADFILEQLRDDEGRLLHRYREGEASIPAFADDYAFMIWGLLELYEATFEERRLLSAIELNADFVERFRDDAQGGFYFTPDDGEDLLMRRKEIHDGAVPSANSVALLNLLRLARMTGDSELEVTASSLARTFTGRVNAAPAGYTFFLCALNFALGPSHEVVISGARDAEDTQEMLGILSRRYLPNTVVLFRPDEDDPAIAKLAPFTLDQRNRNGRATAYVCKDYACEEPTGDPERMLELLGE